MQIIIRKKTILIVFLVIIGLAIILATVVEGMNRKPLDGDDMDKVSPTVQMTIGGDMEEPPKVDFAGDVLDGQDFFVEYRIQRDRVRGQRIEYLREIINNPNSNSKSIDEAQEILLDITKIMDKEMELESLIKARGFPDAAVSFMEEASTLILDTGGATDVDKLGLTELVSRGTGLEMGKIDIILK